MVIDNEPTPEGGVAGPLTNPNVPVLLVGSSAHGPFGARSPVLTTVVVVAADAGELPSAAHVPATSPSDANRLIQARERANRWRREEIAFMNSPNVSDRRPLAGRDRPVPPRGT
jgi:hypothetical protein